MPHRQIAVAVVVGLSFWTISRNRAKSLLRASLVHGNRFLLRCSSRAYRPQDGLMVVFAPHQDDETLGCGGLIALRRYEGWPVHVVFLTDGGGSHLNHPTTSVPAIIDRRRTEARAALAELGMESCAIHFLDEPDGTLASIDADRSSALSDRIADLLGKLQPVEVFLPCNPDASSEHDAAHGIIIQAIHRSGRRSSVWQYPIWSWWNPLRLLHHIFHAQQRVRLPLADFTTSKAAAVACYGSQTSPTPPWSESVIPAELLATLQSDAEYFFAHPLPPSHEPLAEI